MAQPLGVKGGQSTPLDGEKFTKNWEKEGENQEKAGTRGKKSKKKKKKEKSGRFFHFAPPDR